MRTIVPIAALAVALCALPAGAAAQEASAAGSLGVGMFGDRPATTVDVGLDVDGGTYAFGLGARLRYLTGTGVRSEDWDTPSEVARILRYLTYTRDEPVRATLAVGELSGARLGHGSILNGYTSGLDVDRGHVGAQLRAAHARFSIDAVLDDVVAPRIAATRLVAKLRHFSAGATVAIDMRAPSMDGEVALPIAGLDLELGGQSYDGLFDGGVYADVVAMTTGGGLHLGGRGSVALGDSDARLGARAEARLGTAGYVPGWIGPLYERARASRLDRARADSGGGVGGLAELSVVVPGVGSIEGSYASRPGTTRLATVGMRAPYLRGVQAALWAAAELGGASPTRALAFEARARLPSAMFVAFEVARLYRSGDPAGGMDSGAMERIWIGTAAVGAVLGD